MNTMSLSSESAALSLQHAALSVRNLGSKYIFFFFSNLHFTEITVSVEKSVRLGMQLERETSYFAEKASSNVVTS